MNDFLFDPPLAVTETANVNTEIKTKIALKNFDEDNCPRYELIMPYTLILCIFIIIQHGCIA